MSSPAGYSRTQIALHWIIALLILLQFIFHDAIEEAFAAIEQGQAEPGGFHPHALIGIVTLVLVIWRLFLRGRRGAPALPDGGNPLQDLVAVWTHRILYALMVLIPISGAVAWNTGAGAPAAAHGAMFFLAVALILLHIAAAIYHQVVLKDGLMDRMKRAG